MISDAQNGRQHVIGGISTTLKMLNLPQKHPFFTFETKKPLKQRVGAHFEHQKSFIYIKGFCFVLWLYLNSFNEGPTPYGTKGEKSLCRPINNVTYLGIHVLQSCDVSEFIIFLCFVFKGER